MAKNLAGLAALGALGLLMSRKQGGGEAPVEDRSGSFESYGRADDVSPRAEDSFMEPLGRTPSLDKYSYSNERTINNSSNRTPVRTNKPSNASQGLDANSPDIYVPGNTQGRATQGPVRMVQGARPVGPGNIPGGGPTVQGGEPVDNPSELGKIMQGLGVGAGVAGVGAGAYKAKKAFDALKAADRSAVTNPNMWTAGPKEASKFGKSAKDLIKDKLMEKGLLKKELSEADTTGGAIGYKKGGSIKAKSKPMKLASGGSARSSASKRGDGIASKGRTRGKMY